MGSKPFQSARLVMSIFLILQAFVLPVSVFLSIRFNLRLPDPLPNVGDVLNDTDYAKPLPWIGLYITAASLACGVAMAMDLFRSVCNHRMWFPCRFFSLNATTLALLSIATKLPVDLNSKMPSPIDQLSKLSSTVFLCSAMGNLLPSIGSMASSEIRSNVGALAILVITIVLNICIQIRTGVIYDFIPQHVAVIILLMILLLIFISSAIAVPATKETLEKIYARKFREILADPQGRNDADNLHTRVKKFWLMAHSVDPQYVLGRSANSTAAGILCFAAYVILLLALNRNSKVKVYNGSSDYAWSSVAVLAAQTVAVFVGTVPPLFRWFNALLVRKPSWILQFKVEEYWTRLLVKWKEAPLNEVRRSNLAKIVHRITIISLWILINLQIVVVQACKVLRFLSALYVELYYFFDKKTHYSTAEITDDCILVHEGEQGLVSLSHNSTAELKEDCVLSLEGEDGLVSLTHDSTAEITYDCVLSHEGEQGLVSLTHNSTAELTEDCVLGLEGDKDLVSFIVLTQGRDSEIWIEKGRKKKPAAMIQLIVEHSTYRTGFTHVDRVLPAEPPPNCWALPLVTLAAIAAALRTTADEEEVKSLLLAVGEGLPYVRLVEKQLDAKGLLKMRGAADIVWMKLRLYNKWLDVELIETGGARREKTALERLRRESAQRREGFLEGMDEEASLELPETTLAAVCMERVCGRILQAREVNNGSLLSWVRTVMVDILGACLTNLPQAIFNECFSNGVEVRVEGVRDAARVLGETEDVLQLLKDPSVASCWPEGRQYIDGWRRGA